MKSLQTITAAVSLIVCVLSSVAGGALSREESYSLFSQANDSFRQATASQDDTQSEPLYDRAILSFEKIISEGNVENAGLYYNLANAYFLKGELGLAILNYRRAQKLDPADANIRNNLAFARSKRIDKVQSPTEKRVLETLFFWHYEFSTETRFLISCICFGVLCLSLTTMVWLGKRAPVTVLAIIAGIGFVCCLASVTTETKAQAETICGVIVAAEVIAHQADWEDSPPSFKEPLHAGTEFKLIEDRPGWLHVQLLDGSSGWIRQTSADLI